MTTPRQELPLQVIAPTAENAEAWLNSLEVVSARQPGAFSADGILVPEQLKEARRYFFAAWHDNNWLH